MPKKTKRSPSKSPFSSPKEEKLFNNLLKSLQQYLSGRSYKPMNPQELMKRLSLPEQHADIFQKIINQLLEQGLIEIVHGNLVWKQPEANVVSGTLNVHPRGFGFLHADQPTGFTDDIFIPKHLTLNAVDGDEVEVLINSEVSEKGPEGRVISILSRGRTHIAGIILEASVHGDSAAYVPLLGTQQRVLVQSHPDHSIKIGDRIVMEVVEWGTKNSDTIARMSHYIGHISDPSCDISAAIEEYELRSDFSNRALQEARQFGTRVSSKDIAGREDLRQLECFTIDPDTAKDYDDAISLSKDTHGTYHLAVHIADVSHYVKPGSALDDEARARCNSTYFPGVCVPMLPSELSNNLCSLKENVNRLSASVLMKFDREGSLIDYRIVRSVIKSAKRFTYRQAKQILDGTVKNQHIGTLKLMVELCALLKKKRYERGSIEFAIPELIVIVGEDGVPQRLDYIEYDITHQLVEEFMLKANEVVATHLSQLGKNLTYRVHEEPAEDNMKDFSMLARAFGFNLSEIPTSFELREMFDEALKTPYGQYLASSYIRRMRLAVYSAENIGHYGLGLTHYCHFTSPIRRYIDLVVHRILFEQAEDLESLEAIALECSEQERISAKAEQNVVLLKKLRLLQSVKEKEPYRQYEAVVTRIKPFGISFEVLEFMLDGFLHVSELENDYFVYQESEARLMGARHGKAYVSGDKITLMLHEVDLVRMENTWSLVAETKRPAKTQATPKSRPVKTKSKRQNKKRPPIKKSSKKKNKR